jgi:hypothetical protein
LYVHDIRFKSSLKKEGAIAPSITLLRTVLPTHRLAGHLPAGFGTALTCLDAGFHVLQLGATCRACITHFGTYAAHLAMML